MTDSEATKAGDEYRPVMVFDWPWIFAALPPIAEPTTRLVMRPGWWPNEPKLAPAKKAAARKKAKKGTDP